MTRQTWTAAVSALLFVLSAAVIALVPIPFVTYGPGRTIDLLGEVDGRAAVRVSGETIYPASGKLLVTTAQVTPVDGSVALPAALFAWWSSAHEVLPRWAVFPAGVSAGDLASRDSELMGTSQQDAAAAGLRLAGLTVERVPIVVSVTDTGPAAARLKAGDLILQVDGKETPTEVAVRAAIGDRAVGDLVVFTVLRNRVETQVRVPTVASKTQAGVPVVGIRLGMGYHFQPHVEIDIDPAIGGSSAGLIMALAVYERTVEEGLIAERVVSGTGQIDGDGQVFEVAAVQSKVVAAKRDGAQVFLVPEGNCYEVLPEPGMQVVPVKSLEEAVGALEALADPDKANQVRSCP